MLVFYTKTSKLFQPLEICLRGFFIFSFMDYKTALLELMQKQPELIPDAQRLFFSGADDISTDDQPNVSTNSWERIYKALKQIADKQTLKA